MIMLILVPSGAPQNFVVTADGSRSLWLTWEPPSEENRNGPITSYTAVIISDGGFFMEPTVVNTQLILSDLTPFTTYICSVAANTALGQGPHTMNATVTTPEDGMKMLLILMSCLLQFHVIYSS